LFANNQHPLQLSAYQEYNRFLADLHNKQESEMAEDLNDRFTQVVEERSTLLNKAEGESLSIDDLSDIYMQVKGESRSKNNHSLNTVTKNGDVADYLETRRPFGASQSN
jgi:hypothetical protein